MIKLNCAKCGKEFKVSNFRKNTAKFCSNECVRIDLTGQKFGRLKVIKFAYKEKKNNNCHYYWLCKCDCGNKKNIERSKLKNGDTKSCGCLNLELIKKRATTHGMSETRFYKIWTGMKERCCSPNNPAYKHYGGRGIKCEWKSFEEFKEDMYESYLEHVAKHGEKKTTIERDKNHLGYNKKNCSWATQKIQGNNTRANRLITHEGRTQTATQWEEELGLSQGRLYARINVGGWSIKKALTTKHFTGRNQYSK